jgi:Flp pilus assembly protein CpaB
MPNVLGGKGNKGVLVLALFLGLLSAVLVFVYLSQSGGGEEAAPSGQTKSVVVASQDISAGTRITEDMVRVKNVSADAVVPNALTGTDMVVGSVARFPINADEQILENRLAAGGIEVPKGENVPLTYIVPEGMRAMAVNTKQVITAGGLVLPGDWVDVIFVAAVKTDLPPPLDLSHISQTVLQNVEVLAVQQTVEDVVPEGTSDGTGDGDGQVSDRVAVDLPDPEPEAITVTVAVTAEQAEILAMADVIADASENDDCDIRLSVRRFGDQETASVPAMTDFELVSLEVLESLIRTMKDLALPVEELKNMVGQ